VARGAFFTVNLRDHCSDVLVCHIDLFWAAFRKIATEQHFTDDGCYLTAGV